MFPDAAVHQRLGITRLVGFVVSQAAKSNHIQDDVLLVSLAIVEGDAHGAKSRFGIVAIDVKDRRLRHPRYVRRVNRRTPSFRRSSKSDLIVNDDVNRSARTIA